MAISSKDDNVFRYIHFRGVTPGTNVPAERVTVTRGEERNRGRTFRRVRELLRRVQGSLGYRPALPSATSSPAATDLRERPGAPVRRRDLLAAKQELEWLRPGSDVGIPALKLLHPERLSDGTSRAVASVGGLSSDSVVDLLSRLNDAIETKNKPGKSAGGTSDPVALVRSVGVADLLVVKQQITRYEAGEIAHVENVLAGEGKKRTHRKLDRIEEESATMREDVTTQERELEATERFELNKETTTTAQRDYEQGFGLSLSGKYGPTVEFSAEYNSQTTTSRTDTERQAVEYAKDLVERSKDAIVSTVREERRRRVLREVEELNEHTLANTSATHSAGVYQFLDKVYTSQVFNYGLREMFDLLVPEPASYVLHLNDAPRADVELPVPPIDLTQYAMDASDINEGNYLSLAARYRVEKIKPPPPAWLLRRGAVVHGTGDVDEEGQPSSFEAIDIEIPDGYSAIFAEVTAVLTSDDQPTMVLTAGTQTSVWSGSDFTVVDLGQGNFKARTIARTVVFDDEGTDYGSQEKLAFRVFATETANYIVKVKLHFWRSTLPLSWRIATYDAIAAAYNNQRLQYEQQVSELQARQEQEFIGTSDFGSPPARNQRLIKEELKKHCIAILRGTHDDDLSTAHLGGGDAQAEDPPKFNIAEAAQDGRTIRFLETAFEWDQIQYVFYPYFWARSGTWPQRHGIRNIDPFFEDFLRAGSARVVVPVQPGFEAAVAHYLTTREVYGGAGEPTVTNPLYKSIVDEIKQRTGGTNAGELAVGGPWETRIPTVAVKVREDGGLPEWQRTSETGWEWGPKV